jgi:hypothetical protein
VRFSNVRHLSSVSSRHKIEECRSTHGNKIVRSTFTDHSGNGVVGELIAENAYSTVADNIVEVVASSSVGRSAS